jgi:hypothetical protein
VPRLQEVAPPPPDPALTAWLKLPKSPADTPTLAPEITVPEGRQTTRANLQNHPEIRELFDWYVASQWIPWAAAEVPRR